MSATATRPQVRSRVLADLLIASTAPLATLALYLPSGVLMPYRLAILGLVVVAALRLARRRPLQAPRVTAALAAITASTVVFGAIACLRYPGRTSLGDAVLWLLLWCLALAVSLVCVTRRTMIWLMTSWLFAALASAVVGLWEVATQEHLPANQLAAHVAKTMPWINIVASFFDNPNLYAYQCGIVLLLIPAAVGLTPPPGRWVVAALGVLIAFMLVVTGGRLALVAVAIGVAAWCVRWRWSCWALAGSAVAFVVAVFARFGPALAVLHEVNYALYEFTERGASSWVRLELARSGGWMLQQTGFLGTGPGGFAAWAPLPENPFQYERMSNAHSGLVEIGSQFGVVTLGLVLAALIAAVVVGVRRSLAGPSPERRLVAYALAVQALTWPVLTASHSTWARQPLAGAHLALIVALAAYALSSGSVAPTWSHRGHR